ncbi:hypothetical protein CAXC1_80029 [Candidatus Xenohaliotis californiensis]|uniref:Uncharacterized protein n=1 Tax=Candidatus Xenohaliotis californiensis TaxID=84677 RepID=A0ABP0EZ02_9RICK|nr:hypothetical protein CAXC1_80029 [Candidatus Xenohaliotis californiensis]
MPNQHTPSTMQATSHHETVKKIITKLSKKLSSCIQPKESNPSVYNQRYKNIHTIYNNIKTIATSIDPRFKNRTKTAASLSDNDKQRLEVLCGKIRNSKGLTTLDYTESIGFFIQIIAEIGCQANKEISAHLKMFTEAVLESYLYGLDTTLHSDFLNLITKVAESYNNGCINKESKNSIIAIALALIITPLKNLKRIIEKPCGRTAADLLHCSHADAINDAIYSLKKRLVNIADISIGAYPLVPCFSIDVLVEMSKSLEQEPSYSTTKPWEDCEEATSSATLVGQPTSSTYDPLKKLLQLIRSDEAASPKDQEWLKCIVLTASSASVYLKFEHSLSAESLWSALNPNKIDRLNEASAETQRLYYDAAQEVQKSKFWQKLDFSNADLSIEKLTKHLPLKKEKKCAENIDIGHYSVQHQPLIPSQADSLSIYYGFAVDCITLHDIETTDLKESKTRVIAEFLQKIGCIPLETADKKTYSFIFTLGNRFNIPRVMSSLVKKAMIMAILDNLEYVNEIRGEKCEWSEEQIRSAKVFVKANTSKTSEKDSLSEFSCLEEYCTTKQTLPVIKDLCRKLDLFMYKAIYPGNPSFAYTIGNFFAKTSLDTIFADMVNNKNHGHTSIAPEKLSTMLSEVDTKDDTVDKWENLAKPSQQTIGDSSDKHSSYSMTDWHDYMLISPESTDALENIMLYLSPCFLAKIGIVPDNLSKTELCVLIDLINTINYYARKSRDNNVTINLTDIESMMVALSVTNHSSSHNKTILKLFKKLLSVSNKKFSDFFSAILFAIVCCFNSDGKLTFTDYLISNILENFRSAEKGRDCLYETISTDRTIPASMLTTVSAELGQLTDAPVDLCIIIEDGKKNIFDKYNLGCFSFSIPRSESSLTKQEKNNATNIKVGTGFHKKYQELAVAALNKTAGIANMSRRMAMVSDSEIFREACNAVTSPEEEPDTNIVQSHTTPLHEPESPGIAVYA